MAQFCDVEWCHSALNLAMGCRGCELHNPNKPELSTCYAFLMTERFKGSKGFPNSFSEPKIFGSRIFQALKWSDLTGLDCPVKPWLNGLPRHIFLNDMGDTFTEDLPVNWLHPFVPEMARSAHVWQILTKRPSRMIDCFRLLGYVPDNFRLGVSVTMIKTLKRIEIIRQMKALYPRVHLFISFEPLLEDVGDVDLRGFAGIIVGGESGAKAREMKKEWVLNLKQCAERDHVPFFFKQWGEYRDGQRLGTAKTGADIDGIEYREMMI